MEEDNYELKDYLAMLSGKHLVWALLIGVIGVLLEDSGNGSFMMKARILKKVKRYVKSDASFEDHVKNLFND